MIGYYGSVMPQTESNSHSVGNRIEHIYCVRNVSSITGSKNNIPRCEAWSSKSNGITLFTQRKRFFIVVNEENFRAQTNSWAEIP